MGTRTASLSLLLSPSSPQSATPPLQEANPSTRKPLCVFEVKCKKSKNAAFCPVSIQFLEKMYKRIKICVISFNKEIVRIDIENNDPRYLTAVTKQRTYDSTGYRINEISIDTKSTDFPHKRKRYLIKSCMRVFVGDKLILLSEFKQTCTTTASRINKNSESPETYMFFTTWMGDVEMETKKKSIDEIQLSEYGNDFHFYEIPRTVSELVEIKMAKQNEPAHSLSSPESMDFGSDNPFKLPSLSSISLPPILGSLSRKFSLSPCSSFSATPSAYHQSPPPFMHHNLLRTYESPSRCSELS